MRAWTVKPEKINRCDGGYPRPRKRSAKQREITARNGEEQEFSDETTFYEH
jgi:hypothetical protein